jgi:hypothetical protein
MSTLGADPRFRLTTSEFCWRGPSGRKPKTSSTIYPPSLLARKRAPPSAVYLELLYFETSPTTATRAAAIPCYAEPPQLNCSNCEGPGIGRANLTDPGRANGAVHTLGSGLYQLG